MNRNIPFWGKLSIRHKLLLLFIAVVIIPSGVTILLCDQITRRVVIDHTRDTMRLDARIVAASINESINRYFGYAKQYRSAVGGSYCHPDDTVRTLHIKENAVRRAAALVDQQSEICSVSVWDRSGTTLVEQHREGDGNHALDPEAALSAWQGKTTLSGLFVSAVECSSCAQVVTPVFDSVGEVVAIAVISLEIQNILESIQIGDDTFESKDFIILDADGIRIWDTTSNDCVLKPALELSSTRRTQIIQTQRFGPETSQRIARATAIPGYLGPESVSHSGGFFDTQIGEEPSKGFARSIGVGDQSWTLLYMIPESAYYDKLNRVKAVIVWAALFAAGGALFLGLWLSGTMVKPIIRLNDALGQFAQGDHTVRMESTEEDEIGALSQSFNQMVVSVMSFQYEVEQQNEDLSEANRKMRLLNTGLEETVRERTDDIRKEKEKLDAVVDCAGVALTTVDQSMTVTWSNGIVETVFPELADLRGTTVSNENGELSDWPITRVLADGQTHTDTVLVEGDGTTKRWWHVTAVPMLDAQGGMEGILEMVQDVTQRKMSIQRMLQYEKMSSIGYLASGISHEFNNIMCAILGHANLAKTNPAKLERLVEVVTSQCDRASKITQGLLNMSRRKESEMICSDVIALTDEVVDLIENDVTKEQIQIVRHYSGDAHTLVNESHFQQVILALIINSRQAIGRNGQIDITIELSEEVITIDVTDNGCGIPAEQLGRVFEPFFTTKGALGKGKEDGTGLGLSSVYNIVTNHGGQISVQSEVDHGTTVSITLPVLGERREADVPVERDHRVPDSTSQTRQVLVVDDDEELRELLKILLTLEKHEVTLACNAEEALDKTAGRTFDFVFLDLHMPGAIDSWTALEEIKRTAPKTKVILISGSDLGEATESVNDADAFLYKPFDNEQIHQIIAQVDGDPSTGSGADNLCNG